MSNRRLICLTVAFFTLILGGTFAYRLVEGQNWSILDGLFMTVITLFTVGYAEVHPLSDSGRILTIVLIFVGGGFMAYVASSLAQLIFEGKIREIWGLKRMKNRINELKDHYIICGAGKTAHEIIKSLSNSNPTNFVVIDIDRSHIQKLQEENIFAIEGDATTDSILIDAGIERAAGLAATLPTDADNVFVTLSAKGIKNDIFVVAKAERIESIAKLRRAGANKVVSPNIIAGARMAAMLHRPSVVDFVDSALAGDNQAMQMEEFRVQKQAFLSGKALKDAEIRQRSGAIIVAIRRESETIINPVPTYVFQPHDVLVVLGTKEQITNFATLTNN
ncbi:MAG: voltage-gated potassium channel [Clostridiales bacterium]|jgi:voltage-gated potassium channel|nr:voltage-gated potassium channel [Clostridiales bacterium]MDN5282152.1 voltage-gated potassium channel [Candidatus Ozemobacter sp.]